MILAQAGDLVGPPRVQRIDDGAGLLRVPVLMAAHLRVGHGLLEELLQAGLHLGSGRLHGDLGRLLAALEGQALGVLRLGLGDGRLALLAVLRLPPHEGLEGGRVGVEALGSADQGAAHVGHGRLLAVAAAPTVGGLVVVMIGAGEVLPHEVHERTLLLRLRGLDRLLQLIDDGPRGAAQAQPRQGRAREGPVAEDEAGEALGADTSRSTLRERVREVEEALLDGSILREVVRGRSLGVLKQPLHFGELLRGSDDLAGAHAVVRVRDERLRVIGHAALVEVGVLHGVAVGRDDALLRVARRRELGVGRVRHEVRDLVAHGARHAVREHHVGRHSEDWRRVVARVEADRAGLDALLALVVDERLWVGLEANHEPALLDELRDVLREVGRGELALHLVEGD